MGFGLGLEVREGDLAALVRVELLEGLLDRALLGHAALRLLVDGLAQYRLDLVRVRVRARVRARVRVRVRARVRVRVRVRFG